MTVAGWFFRRPELPDDEQVGLDDDDLEEVQTLLWRGYVPPKYVPDTPPGLLYPTVRGEVPRTIWQTPSETYRSPRRRKYGQWQGPPRPPEPPGRAEPRLVMPKGSSQFQCAHCRRWFLAPQTEEEAEAEFQATFGDIPKDNRVALCEPCYDRAMAKLSAVAV